MSRESLNWKKLFFFESALNHMHYMADGVNVKTNDLTNQACFVCNIQRIGGVSIKATNQMTSVSFMRKGVIVGREVHTGVMNMKSNSVNHFDILCARSLI